MITVVGATGNIGRSVVRELISMGERPRIITRDRTRSTWSEAEVETYEGDIRTEVYRARALEGTDRLFTLAFVEEQPPILPNLLEEARRAGIRQIVLLSSIGAASSISIGRRHAEAEEVVKASGIGWTFLRPGYLMSNTLRWAPAVKRESRVVTPAADGTITPIAEGDIGLAAAICLTQTGQEGRTHVLTGASITARQQVAALSEVLGRELECIDEDPDEAAARLLKLGRPSWVVDGLRTMWTEIREGRGAHGDDAFERLSGRVPTGYRQWAAEHRAAFE